jgi:LPS export ABC transporter protein LptC
MGGYKKAPRDLAHFLLVLSLASHLTLSLFSCSHPLEEYTDDGVQTEIADASFVDLTREEYRGGKLSMQISAHRASWYESDQRLEIEGLTFTTYDTVDGSVSASGEADKAVFYETSGDAEFSGYVCVRSAEGDISFETSTLLYRRALDVFETPAEAEVVIKAKDRLWMAGQGLLFDVKQKYYEIQRGISGSVYR